MTTGLSRPRHQDVRAQWPWLLVVAAWIVAVVATLTGQRFLIDHHYLLEESGLPWPLAASVFLIGWQVMIVAMMAPASIPFARVTLTDLQMESLSARWRRQSRAHFFAAYVGVWTTFGLLAFSGDTMIHHAVDAWPWLAAHSYLIGATTLALAGLYQFTRWKRISLARCRADHAPTTASEVNPIMPHWRLGLRHGLDSVCCCWALMLIMFGIGVGELGWMAALTLMMVGETALPRETHSRLACDAIGVGLIVLAGLWLAHPAWLMPVTAA